MRELWAPVAEFDGLYEVSDCGRVRSTARQGPIRRVPSRLLKLCRSRCGGYYRAVLYVGARQFRRLVHRMVAQAFIPNAHELPQINHKDGDKLNNRADNLEWCTPQENAQHSYAMGLSVSAKGERHGQSKLTIEQIEEMRRLSGSMTQREIARRFGVTQPQVSKIITSKRWAHVA